MRIHFDAERSAVAGPGRMSDAGVTAPCQHKLPTGVGCAATVIVSFVNNRN